MRHRYSWVSVLSFLLLLALYVGGAAAASELYLIGPEGKAYYWGANPARWRACDYHRIQKADFVFPTMTHYGGNRAVLVRNGTSVEVSPGGDKEPYRLELNAPPGGMYYKAAHRDGKGNVAVELGGEGLGFNFVGARGYPVIVWKKMEWAEGVAPAIRALAANETGRGFVGLDDKGALWLIDPPTTARREFRAKRLSGDGVYERLISAAADTIAVRTDGGLFRMEASRGEDPVFEAMALPTEVGLCPADWQSISTEIVSDGLPAREFVRTHGPQPKPPPIPLNDLVTYVEFKRLVKDAVARVPDLKKLWEYRRTGRIAGSVYFGGGAFRGLLKWLHAQLQTKSADAVRTMPVPSVASLLILKDADKDIWVPDGWSGHMGRWGYGEWDDLPEKFFQGSVIAGGPTLEKIRVNPDEIDDPLDGLKAFYQGELRFHLASREAFASVGKYGLRDNSQAALVLRYLRFLSDLPHLVPDPGSLQAIRAVAAREDGKPLRHNYWIAKAYRKLRESTKRNTAALLSALSSANLVTFLYRLGVLSPEDIRATDVVKDLKAVLGFDFERYPDIEHTVCENDDERIHLRSALVPLAKTPRDFLRLYAVRDRLGNAFDARVSDFIEETAEAFFATGPTGKQIRVVETKRCATLKSRLRIKRMGLRRAKTAAEFLTIYGRALVFDNRDYDAAVDALGDEFAATFDSLGPTDEERQRFHRIRFEGADGKEDDEDEKEAVAGCPHLIEAGGHFDREGF